MGKYIKYKRFSDSHKILGFTEHIQKFLDKLIEDGWIIISYDETLINSEYRYYVMCGKENKNQEIL